MLKLRTLGILDLSRPDGTAVQSVLAQPKRATLLVYLAVSRPAGYQRRDTLLALFWPGSDEASARHSLSQALYSLRQSLGVDALEIRGNDEVALATGAVTCDALSFEEAVANGRWAEALDLYQGDFLAGVHVNGADGFERWMAAQGERLREEAARAAWSLAREQVGRGALMEAESTAARALRLAPADESAARMFMSQLASAGDSAAALRFYEKLKAVLADELELEPSAKTREVLESVRQRSAVMPPEADAGRPGDRRDRLNHALADRHELQYVPAAGSRRMLVLGGAGGLVLVAIVAALVRGGPEGRVEFGAVRPVTTEAGLEVHPALSPDGKMLAYAAGSIGRMRVYVRSLSGGTPIPVAPDLALNQQWPRWSPDGTRLLLRGGDSTYVVPALGGTPRVLVNARYAAWSPDGKSLAYVSDDTLFTRGVDGGPAKSLARALELHSPAWSPDGRFIAAVSTNDAFANATNSFMGNLAPSVLMIVRASGGEAVRLTGRKFLNTNPQWLPDSRHLLILSSQDGGRDLYSLLVDGRGRPRGRPVRLTTGLDIGSFSISRDGTQLAYSVFPNTANIWAIPIPASSTMSEAEAVQVTTGNQHIESMSVSRDGKWLAFDSDRQGNSDLYVMPLGGGGPRQVTTDPSYDFAPTWSPDSRELAFFSWRNESRDVFVVPAGGGEEVMAAGGPNMERYPSWGPDGQRLVYGGDATGRSELFTVVRGPDGRWRAPRQLTREGGGGGHWSPDGQAIVYLRGGSVWVIAPEGGAPRSILSQEAAKNSLGVPGVVIWSPDSHWVYIKAGGADRPASFWVVPATGGRPRLLARFANPDFANSRQDFATDGKRLFFTKAERQADIKVMEVKFAHSRR